MTHEEAIKTIQVAIAEVEWEYAMDYSVAFETAMEALDKLVAKKPIYSGGHEYICPNCNRFIRKREHQHGNIIIPYCKWCGQALDWSDTE